MQHKKWNEKLDAITQELQKEFPQTFPERPHDKVALAVGIKRHVVQWGKEHGYDKSTMNDVIYYWAHGQRYREALKNAAHSHKRYGIKKVDGQWQDAVIQYEYPITYKAQITKRGKWYGYTQDFAGFTCGNSITKKLQKQGFKVTGVVITYPDN